MKFKGFSLFILQFTFYIVCNGQANNQLSQKAFKDRDSLMAVSILNLDSNFIYITGGTFEMGLPDTSDVEGGDIEKPRHKVTLKSFFILKTQVTQALWFSIMDTNPSVHKDCFSCPVENVRWYDAQKFITKLNTMNRGRYRLPTEAEYEYAAGGGNKRTDLKYSGSNDINEVGWFVYDSKGASHPVGQKKPNELGLFDMSGNVWEWCSDWYDPNYYKSSPSDNPSGPIKGQKKALRGGTWISLDEGCMVTSRAALEPSLRSEFNGFRIVKDP